MINDRSQGYSKPEDTFAKVSDYRSVAHFEGTIKFILQMWADSSQTYHSFRSRYTNWLVYELRCGSSMIGILPASASSFFSSVFRVSFCQEGVSDCITPYNAFRRHLLGADALGVLSPIPRSLQGKSARRFLDAFMTLLCSEEKRKNTSFPKLYRAQHDSLATDPFGNRDSSQYFED